VVTFSGWMKQFDAMINTLYNYYKTRDLCNIVDIILLENVVVPLDKYVWTLLPCQTKTD